MISSSFINNTTKILINSINCLNRTISKQENEVIMLVIITITTIKMLLIITITTERDFIVITIIKNLNTKNNILPIILTRKPTRKTNKIINDSKRCK